MKYAKTFAIILFGFLWTDATLASEPRVSVAPQAFNLNWPHIDNVQQWSLALVDVVTSEQIMWYLDSHDACGLEGRCEIRVQANDGVYVASLRFKLDDVWSEYFGTDTTENPYVIQVGGGKRTGPMQARVFYIIGEAQ